MMESFESMPLSDKCEAIIRLSSCPAIEHRLRRAFYCPLSRSINVPAKQFFENEQEYYSTVFHEMIHWAIHACRLAQNILTIQAKEYARLEIDAELGATYLCRTAGFTSDRSEAYIRQWMRTLRNNAHFLINAGGTARMAENFILCTGEWI